MSEIPLHAHVSTGTDLEDVSRFADAGPAVARLFTETELAHAEGRATSLAGTWCAKEATVKALWPWVRLDPRRVHVHHDPDGRPTVEVTAWEARPSGLRVSVSVAHTATVASAVAVAWGPPPDRPEHEGEQR